MWLPLSLAASSSLLLAASEAGEAEYPFIRAIVADGSEVDGITMLVAIDDERHQH